MPVKPASTDNTSFDFSTPLQRTGVASQKWQPCEGRDVLPMWVADMDFLAPPCVQNTLTQAAQKLALGYGTVTAEVASAFVDWCQQRYGWAVDPEWLVWLPGVVPGLHHAVAAWLAPEQGLTVQTPVYPPIRTLASVRGRPGQALPLSAPEPGEPWSLGVDDMIANTDPQSRALVLCNPQNPTGRVYCPDELQRLADWAAETDRLVISDEIWADLILRDDLAHHPFGAVCDRAAQRSVTLMSASKTFNIAGLCCAVAIIPNPSLRKRFQQQCRGLGEPSYLGLLASQSAWQDGERWRQALLAQLNRNLDVVMAWVDRQSGVSVTRPEATFVVWLDVRDSGLNKPTEAFLDGGVALSDGAAFGQPGFVRLNIGCPEAQLLSALQRMEAVLVAS